MLNHIWRSIFTVYFGQLCWMIKHPMIQWLKATNCYVFLQTYLWSSICTVSGWFKLQDKPNLAPGWDSPGEYSRTKMMDGASVVAGSFLCDCGRGGRQQAQLAKDIPGLCFCHEHLHPVVPRASQNKAQCYWRWRQAQAMHTGEKRAEPFLNINAYCHMTQQCTRRAHLSMCVWLLCCQMQWELTCLHTNSR